MGLGPFPVVTLAEAREKAIGVRRILRIEGLDPLELRARDREERRRLLANSTSFRTCAEQFLASHQIAWKNAKHILQWKRTLETYAYPVLGKCPVAAIDTNLVLQVLQPIWTTTTETASRLRGRIERILQYATTAGFRSGENPARWKGHLENLLPKPAQIAPSRNQPALAWEKIPEMMAKLRAIDSTAARALEFTILTAARTGETLGARWQEINLDEALWTVPAHRIKGKREHRVPLAFRAMQILAATNRSDGDHGGFVFASDDPGKPLSNMTMLMLLRRMGFRDVTVQGFRSSFRDWAAENTNAAREVAEMALAHVIPSKSEAAYRRGDLLEKRRQLMSEWTTYCESAF